jgi:hypothetical protein
MDANSSAADGATAGAHFRLPEFEIAGIEMPAAVRDAAIKWIYQGRQNVEKVITVIEETSGVFERACFSTAKGSANYGAKVAETLHTSTTAAFDFAHELVAARSLPEIMKVSSANARKHFDALAAQNQELWALTQQFRSETIKPFAGALPGAFRPLIAAWTLLVTVPKASSGE